MNALRPQKHLKHLYMTIKKELTNLYSHYLSLILVRGSIFLCSLNTALAVSVSM